MSIPKTETTPAAEAAEGPRVVQSVSRAIGLLKTLAAQSRAMTLGELAAAVGLSKPSTFHMLRTLELEGFVSKTAEAAYQLDWGLYELGSSVIRSVDLTRVARVHLDDLAELTGEAVLLSILDGDSVLYLDRGQAVESFAMVANMGRRSPLHTNASGKVLLAYQPEQFISDFLGQPLVPRTQATLIDPRELAQALAAVRLNGYSTCWEEEELGLCSVAVPVRDYTGNVCAAMAVAGPAQRVNHATGPGLVDLLLAAAARVSRALGAPAEQ
ncbi:IclR family transcriptional regulator [Arthrobacter sp. 9V]|uniref:IclR family transcriptional regulator n=1 Tax=Arthrobacter sp. 9V TaxID=2653132 RepID=UPI0012F357F2|nr:IclR family transcriptional regulator [Arthrobacter sp. 9V]VXB65962.1 IclR family transcriptional regulator [Arthrobacter sp. 9V]